MFETVNQILFEHSLNRIIAIGLEFCGEGSEPLQDCMRQQSLQYFKTYHRLLRTQ